MKYNIRKDSYKFSRDSVDFFINVGFQITRRCNLKCIYCCEAEQIADSGFNVIKKIIDKLTKNGLKKICVTGGEPLLRDDLIKILKYIRKKNIYISLSTNGLFLDKKKIKKIKPYIDNIRFSLRGLKKTHNKISKNNNSFDKTIENIHNSIELKIPVSVVTTIISKNYKEMLNIARLCENNKVGKLYFFSLIPRGRGKSIFNKENISFNKIKTEYNRILGISKKEHWNMEINVIDWSIEGQCVLVLPNGDVAGVPSFVDKDNTKIIGNILMESPQKLWENYPFKENYINYYKNH